MTNQYFISKAELKRLESIKLQNSYDVVFNIMAKSLTGKQEFEKALEIAKAEQRAIDKIFYALGLNPFAIDLNSLEETQKAAEKSAEKMFK